MKPDTSPGVATESSLRVAQGAEHLLCFSACTAQCRVSRAAAAATSCRSRHFGVATTALSQIVGDLESAYVLAGVRAVGDFAIDGMHRWWHPHWYSSTTRRLSTPSSMPSSLPTSVHLGRRPPPGRRGGFGICRKFVCFFVPRGRKRKEAEAELALRRGRRVWMHAWSSKAQFCLSTRATSARVVITAALSSLSVCLVPGELHHQGGRGGPEEDGPHKPHGQTEGVHGQGTSIPDGALLLLLLSRDVGGRTRPGGRLPF